MSARIKFWRKSPMWRKLRRPQKLGAFKKWKRTFAEEAQRIEERFERETGEQSFG
jgi:hypothetical protein